MLHPPNTTTHTHIFCPTRHLSHLPSGLCVHIYLAQRTELDRLLTSLQIVKLLEVLHEEGTFGKSWISVCVRTKLLAATKMASVITHHLSQLALRYVKNPWLLASSYHSTYSNVYLTIYLVLLLLLSSKYNENSG